VDSGAVEGSSPSSKIGGKSIDGFFGESTVCPGDGWGAGECAIGAVIAAADAGGTSCVAIFACSKCFMEGVA